MPDTDQPALLAASNLLAAHWRDGTHTDALPPDLRPRSRADAYAIQALIERGGMGRRRGWKIAATSAAGQQHINVDGPLAGRLLADRIVPLGTPVALKANRMRVAEVEFVFRMGRSLPPASTPYTVDAVVEAVSDLLLGVEVPDSRFTDVTAVGEAQLIADNACADRFELGPVVTAPWRDADLAAHAVRGSAGGRVHEGRGGNVLGDPRIALAWLVNELSRNGITLNEAEIVTTGTCVVPLPVNPGDTLTAEYGALGAMQVRFGD